MTKKRKNFWRWAGQTICLALALLLGTATLASCNETRQLIGIAVDTSQISLVQELGSASLDGLLLVQYFDGGKTSVVKLKNEDFSADTLALLQTEGEHVFTVHYLGFTADFTMTIVKPERKQFTGITFESRTFVYDGQEHFLEVSGQPEGTDVEYRNNGKTEIGTYEVIVVLTKRGYEPLLLRANLTITDK